MIGLLSLAAQRPRFPYPTFPLEARLIVERALLEAWEALLANPPAALDLASASEDQITAALQVILNATTSDGRSVLSVFGGDLFEFETVDRSAAVENCVGTKLNKSPDFVFRLVRVPHGVANRTWWGLFGECKVVDRTHPMRLYCSKGVARFVNGDYGCAMDCGLMVAYVRDGTCLPEALETKLSADAALGTEGKLIGRPEPAGGRDRFISRHRRSWAHLDGNQAEPIELSHLWLTLEK